MDLSNNKLQLKRLKMEHKKNCKFSPEKRIEVVTKVMALGNMRLVAELTGVSYQLIRSWKTQPWWKEMTDEIIASRKAQTETKLQKIVDKSLEAVQDRIENGDWKFDRQKQELYREPVSLRDATKTASDLMQRQRDLAKLDVEVSETQNKQTIADQIAMLAREFANFNTKRTVDVVPKEVPSGTVEEVFDPEYHEGTPDSFLERDDSTAGHVDFSPSENQ